MTDPAPPVQVFLFEFVCGGGCIEFSSFGAPAGSLYAEGAEMLRAVADELTSLPNIQVTCPVDSRVASHLNLPQVKTVPVDNLQSLHKSFDHGKETSDYFVAIAPEINHALEAYTKRFEHPQKLLTPGPEVVALCSDKWATFQFLTQHKILTPASRLGNTDQLFTGLNVCKPRWGAGSWGVSVVENWQEVIEHAASNGLGFGDLMIQKYVPGLPSSIGLFRSENSTTYFPAVEQVFRENTLEYTGCGTALDFSMQNRATELLNQVVTALPPFTGYLGIDMVMGNCSDEDYVIEINPRFTTSFCTTRKLVPENCFEFITR